jgi:hypothetical protein
VTDGFVPSFFFTSTIFVARIWPRHGDGAAERLALHFDCATALDCHTGAAFASGEACRAIRKEGAVELVKNNRLEENLFFDEGRFKADSCR